MVHEFGRPSLDVTSEEKLRLATRANVEVGRPTMQGVPRQNCDRFGENFSLRP
jgi:hypothetical protein